MHKRIRQARERSGLSQSELARRLNVRPQSVSRWEAEDGTHPRFKRLEAIASITGADLAWLATGEGRNEAVSGSADGRAQPESMGGVTVTLRPIPILGTTQAGPDTERGEMAAPSVCGTVTMHARSESCYALLVADDSMAPRILEGEAIICDPDAAPVPGEEVLVRLHDGTVMVRVFLNVMRGRLTLDSINEQYRRSVVSEGDVELMHAVIAVARSSAINLA